ncbi:MAG: hypothetical protein HKN43_13305 [Rhodothermales bacterium]|nr:hypothetical protein [Rhodothermales bacterium]
MKSYLPVILLVAGLAFGYFGYTSYADSSASLSVGDVSVSATDEGQRSQAYILIGLSVLFLVSGAVLVTRK